MLLALALWSGASVSLASNRNALHVQERALLEQDIGIALEKQGRGPEAVIRYRAAVSADPRLKTPWANLARHALEDGSPERALHLAGLALSLDPLYDAARRVAEEALEAMPSEDRRKEMGRQLCPSATEGSETVEEARECLERRAGWLAGLPEARSPLEALARLDLDADRPGLAALLLTIAASLGGAEPEGLAPALAGAGDPCGAASMLHATADYRRECEDLRARRGQAEGMLAEELRGATADEREHAGMRLEASLLAGLEPEAAARSWRMEWRRGSRPLRDLGGLSLRLGQEWEPSREIHGLAISVWRRRPGDSAVVAFRLASSKVPPEGVLRGLLSRRRADVARWSSVTLASTDPISARSARVTLNADTGGRVEALLWIAESSLAPGAALVVAAYPGTGGLGADGLEQTREEILEAMRGAVLSPALWSQLGTLEDADDLPVPVAGQGGPEARDERSAPWRVLPAMGFTVALPPGLVVALPGQSPSRSALRRTSAALWFRGRFQDRDGLTVQIGDEQRAGSVDVLDLGSEEQALAHVLAKTGLEPPPLADPDATLVSSLDVTRTLSRETECSAAWIGRFRPRAGRFEWIVARLAYASWVVDVELPVFEGARSIALYWVPSTVRTLHGPPPPPPVDLSGRLGITFVRPRPEERRESFYKEGDLRSADFTLMVPRGYQVVLSSETRDALPVKMTHSSDQASTRLEKLGSDKGPFQDESSLAGSGASLTPGLRPGDPRVEDAIREWLKGEGFALRGRVTSLLAPKPARYGARGAVAATFDARHGNEGDPAAGPAAEPGPASGRALAVETMGGQVYVLLSLCWGEERARREEEIRLMEGSLRLSRRPARR